MNLSQAFTQIGQWFAALAQQVLPAGGTAGQVLTKVDGTDFSVDWETPSGGGGPTVVGEAYTTMTAGAIVRLVMESGATVATVKPSAPDPGGTTIAVGVLQSSVTAGNPATVMLGVVAEDVSAFLASGLTAYLGASNNLTQSPSGIPVGVAMTETSALLTYDFPRPGTISIAGVNADGMISYENDAQINIAWMADSSLAMRRTGPGTYGLTRSTELILSSGASYGIPMYSDTAVILYDSPDSTLFDATNGFAQNKPLRIVQLGAGQVKLDGFAIKCVGQPITNTTNSVIDVIPSALGATVVSGDLAAADTATYYTGLDESTTGFLTNYGCIVDTGGIFNQGTDIQSSRTRDQVPTARAYAEFSVLINGGGTFGFAKSGWLGGELGLNADSMALRVSGDLADLEVWHNGAAVATIAGAGSLGTGVNRFGVLVDRATAEFWIIGTGGVWVGPDPATDPGLPFFPGGIGGSDAWLALEARPGGGEQRLFYLPSSLTWATEATAAGAVQIGWLHP